MSFSASSTSRLSARIVAFALLAAPAAHGGARGIRSLVTEPIAPRGGVLMLPLAASEPGDGWPETIPLFLGDGRVLMGLVTWVEAESAGGAEPGASLGAAAAPRRWTDDIVPRRIRPIAPGDDSRGHAGMPFLLARLPKDGTGTLLLAAGAEHRTGTSRGRAPGARGGSARDGTGTSRGAGGSGNDGTGNDGTGTPWPGNDGTGTSWPGDQTLTPRWCDLPATAGGDAPGELGGATPAAAIADSPGAPADTEPLAEGAPPALRRLPHVEAADRPDPDSPFEYWRWALIAERLGLAPPPTDRYGETAALAAEHEADLWRIGLARLEAVSPGVAAAARDELTLIVQDGDVALAAWVSERAALAALLTALLEPATGEREVAEKALAWIDSRRNLLGWVESEQGPQVRLALVNRSAAPRVARVRWLDAQDVPIAVALPPRSLTRSLVDRPSAPADGTRLEIVAGTESLDVTVGTSVLRARPPGLWLAALRAPLTLAEVEVHHQRRVASERTTRCQIRRLNGRWEIFFECMRPALARAPTTAHGASADAAPLETFGRECDVAGIESVTLVLGREEHPDVALVVPEHGRTRQFAGSGGETLEVHRRSWGDRWYARLVLPEAWLAAGTAERPLLLGVRRSHGDTLAVESAPGTGTPWQQSEGRFAIDCSAWNE